MYVPRSSQFELVNSHKKYWLFKLVNIVLLLPENSVFPAILCNKNFPFYDSPSFRLLRVLKKGTLKEDTGTEDGVEYM